MFHVEPSQAPMPRVCGSCRAISEGASCPACGARLRPPTLAEALWQGLGWALFLGFLALSFLGS